MTAAAVALVAWGATYASVVAWGVGRARARGRRRPMGALRGERVLLVRPCAGAEAGLSETLRSSAADGDPALAIRFAIGSCDDTAGPTARAVAAELRARGYDAQVKVTDARAANRKADQFARTLDGAPRRELVAFADSDVALQPGDLACLLSPFRDAGIGAVWSPPIPSARSATAGDALEAGVLGGSLQAFPVLAALDGGGLVGKLFAVRRSKLEAAGGFGSLVTVLGEDVELGRRLRTRGDRVESAGWARARPRGATAADVVARLSRWLLVVRGQRPALLATYPLLFFPAVPASIAALILGGRLGHVACALFAGARFALATLALPAGVRRETMLRALAFGLAADAALALAFARALARPRTAWRGTLLRVGRGGQLQLEDPR